MDKTAIEGGEPVRKEKLLFSPPSISQEEIDSVVDVLKNKWVTMGKKTSEFENALKGYVGAKNLISTNSCTSALYLSLLANGITNGEVITSTMTFAATGNMIINAGAKPVLVDIENDTMNIDPNKIEEKITERTRAIVPVHYGGHPCDMNKINEIAKRHNLIVIEDAAHAIGAEYNGKRLGSSGTVCFSFYATKNITTGDGGAIATDNNKAAEKISLIRLHGIDNDAWKRYSKKDGWFYQIREAGWKHNLTDIQAALGVAQLKKLDIFIEKRRNIAEYYKKNINKNLVTFSCERSNVKSAWHLFPIRINFDKLKIDRSKFISALQAEGIQVSVHFIPLHLHDLYKKIGYKEGMFPVAESCYKNLVSLPIYPDMTEQDRKDIVTAVNKIIDYYR